MDEYRTFIPGRKRPYVTHRTQRQAKDAVLDYCYGSPPTLKSDAFVYVWINEMDGWFLLSRYYAGTLREDLHLD